MGFLIPNPFFPFQTHSFFSISPILSFFLSIASPCLGQNVHGAVRQYTGSDTAYRPCVCYCRLTCHLRSFLGMAKHTPGGNRSAASKARRQRKRRSQRMHATPQAPKAILKYWALAVQWASKTLRDPVYAFFGSVRQYPCSNHAAVPVFVDGVKFRTSEHAYMATKCRAYGLYDMARDISRGQGRVFAHGLHVDLTNPKSIKPWCASAIRCLRAKGTPMDQAWEASKDRHMYNINYKKFRGNHQARLALYQTGDAYLVENAPYDSHWGIGRPISQQDLQLGPLAPNANWRENKMGMILMAVRAALRAETNLDARVSARRLRKSYNLYCKKETRLPRGIIPLPQYMAFQQIHESVFRKRIREKAALKAAATGTAQIAHIDTRRKSRLAKRLR